jgi:hypothetical protein
MSYIDTKTYDPNRITARKVQWTPDQDEKMLIVIKNLGGEDLVKW